MCVKKNMGIGQFFEKALVKLGADNSPTLVAVGVATAKGIFRPIFTMADKKQDKETKKYTAIREGLTEAIAIPIYWGSGKLAHVLAKNLAKPKEMTKEAFEKIIKDRNLVEKSAIDIKKNYSKMAITGSMFGVFLSALVVIPAVCSMIIKPLMKIIQKPKKETIDKVPEQQISVVNEKPVFKSNSLRNRYLYTSSNYGMKVGGV